MKNKAQDTKQGQVKKYKEQDINYWVKRALRAEERAKALDFVSSLGIFMVGISAIIIATNFAHMVR